MGSHSDWALSTTFSIKGDHIISGGCDMSVKLTDVASAILASHHHSTAWRSAVLARYEGNYAATTVTVMGDRSGLVWKEPPPGTSSTTSSRRNGSG